MLQSQIGQDVDHDEGGETQLQRGASFAMEAGLFDMLFDVCHALLRVCAVRCGRLAGRLRRGLVFVGLYYADAQR